MSDCLYLDCKKDTNLLSNFVKLRSISKRIELAKLIEKNSGMKAKITGLNRFPILGLTLCPVLPWIGFRIILIDNCNRLFSCFSFVLL